MVETKPAWIKSTLAWKAEGGHWRCVPHLVASERIAAGISLTIPGSREELLHFLAHVRDTTPPAQITIVRWCPVVEQPVLAWSSKEKAFYQWNSEKCFSDRQKRVSLYCSLIKPEKDRDGVEAISDFLWKLLGQHFEQCNFAFEGGIYVALDGEELTAEIAVQAV